MATPEAKTKGMIDRMLKPLKDDGVLFYFKPAQGKFANPGIPDYVLCYKGQFISIEAKADGKAHNTTIKQDMAMQSIRDSGGLAFVVSNRAEMEETLKIILGE